MWRKFVIVLLIFFGLIQLFRADRSVPPIDVQLEFMTITDPPEEIAELLKVACYDCHSHTTKYPWYSQVAPVSWWIDQHVDEGREHLNFSEWGRYSAKKADQKLEECVEELAEGHMPIRSYPLLHAKARLSDVQRDRLVDWFEQIRTVQTSMVYPEVYGENGKQD